MPRITLENDPSVFVVETPHGEVLLNAFVLTSVLADMNISDTSDTEEDKTKIIEATKQVAKGPIEKFSNHELFALASVVMLKFSELGNAQKP